MGTIGHRSSILGGQVTQASGPTTHGGATKDRALATSAKNCARGLRETTYTHAQSHCSDHAQHQTMPRKFVAGKGDTARWQCVHGRMRRQAHRLPWGRRFSHYPQEKQSILSNISFRADRTALGQYCLLRSAIRRSLLRLAFGTIYLVSTKIFI